LGQESTSYSGQKSCVISQRGGKQVLVWGQKFSLRAVYMGFMVEEVALRWVFLQALWFHPTQYHSTNALYPSIISCQYCRLISGGSTRGLILSPHIHLRKVQSCLTILFMSCIWTFLYSVISQR